MIQRPAIDGGIGLLQHRDSLGLPFRKRGHKIFQFQRQHRF
jgi:hypothetical protein